MCKVCNGNPPNLSSFSNFKKEAIGALHGFTSQARFLDEAKRIDRLRFETGNEWGEPHILNDVNRLIFNNPDPDEGLLLFTCGCWLDMQAKYVTVWNTYLKQAQDWIHGRGSIPRGGFSLTTRHLQLTEETRRKYGTISQWFLQKTNEIVEKYGRAKGNIYRLAGEVCNELYSKPDVVKQLRQGVLPDDFSGGDHKRFWMFMMFLRRDNSIVRCLFTRALSKCNGGQKAVKSWYDSEFFDPMECELPVDTWVLTNWNKIFGKLRLANFRAKYAWQVAAKARELARENNMSPSAFDALLFYSGGERVNTHNREQISEYVGQKTAKTRGIDGFVVFEDLIDASGLKMHSTDCLYYRRWLENQTTTTKWHGPYKTKRGAWDICLGLASKSKFEPSRHKCVRSP